MRFVTYNQGNIGLLIDGKVIDLSTVLEGLELSQKLTMVDVITNFEYIKPRLHVPENKVNQGTDVESVTLMPPVLKSSKVVCTVDNYPAHAAEDKTEIFPKPIFFLKPSNSLIGHRASVVLPKEARRVDYEFELAVVVGKECRQVPASEASACIFGYTNFLDMSARDFRTIPYSWFSMKGWDTFGPIGPAIVTSDEVPNPDNLTMKLWVNGEPRMTGNTKNMIFNIEKLIEAISEVTTLLPGDVIATGTIDGVAPVVEGDVIVAEIEGLGRLEVAIVRSSHQDTWHSNDFAAEYALFRERDTADKGTDPMAPKKKEDI